VKVIVSLSGGMDSAVLLYKLKADGHLVKALSVNYGQRHLRELDAAARVASAAGVTHRAADLTSLGYFLRGSSQTSREVPVPEGHYTDESMKQTVVPNRNMLLLAVAGCWAVSEKADAVAYAAHAGDHAIYPDCREEFAKAMAEAFAHCDWNTLQLLRPFVDHTKADLVRLGTDLGVPFQLTYSCYKGGPKHCGRCGTDVERKEAFRMAGVPDPTEYEDATGAFLG
jgi:7-cyano-7-deazaguanine synthase